MYEAGFTSVFRRKCRLALLNELISMTVELIISFKLTLYTY